MIFWENNFPKYKRQAIMQWDEISDILCRLPVTNSDLHIRSTYESWKSHLRILSYNVAYCFILILTASSSSMTMHLFIHFHTHWYSLWPSYFVSLLPPFCCPHMCSPVPPFLGGSYLRWCNCSFIASETQSRLQGQQLHSFPLLFRTGTISLLPCAQVWVYRTER